MNISQAQRNELILRKLYLVALERRFGFIKGQFLMEGTHIFKDIAIGILDHLPDLLWGSLHAGCALTDIDAVGL